MAEIFIFMSSSSWSGMTWTCGQCSDSSGEGNTRSARGTYHLQSYCWCFLRPGHGHRLMPDPLPGSSPDPLEDGWDGDTFPPPCPALSLPHGRLLQLGTEQHVGEEEDVPQLPRALRQLHQEAILDKLPGLRGSRAGVRAGREQRPTNRRGRMLLSLSVAQPPGTWEAPCPLGAIFSPVRSAGCQQAARTR